MNKYKNIIRQHLPQLLLQRQNRKIEPEIRQAIDVLCQHSTETPTVYIGTSTCGIIAGADKTLEKIKEYKKNNLPDLHIVEVGCTGMCNAEPVMDIQLPGRQRLSFRNVKDMDVDAIIDGTLNNYPPAKKILGQYKTQGISEWPDVPYLHDLDFFSSQKHSILKRAGFSDPGSLEEYIALNGYNAFTTAITQYTSKELCELMISSKLKGRSGSGYLTGEKWKNGLEQVNSRKYFICNADESDPGSFVDRSIAESDPHLVIEGIAIGAYAVKASEAIIYIRERYTNAIKLLSKAIESCYNAGIIGENIIGSGFNLNIRLIKGPGAFVCGEETALIASIEGRRGMPSTRPPYPTETGLFGKPTIVNNLETIANVRSVIEDGPEEFSKTGTKHSSGTKLFSVSGKIANPGIIEIPMGSKISDVISICGGIPNDKELKAIHVGGPSGGFLSLSELDLNIDYDELINAGVWIGSGSFIVLDEDNCIVDTSKYFIDFIKNESCGKCIPCREGSHRIGEILSRITKKTVNNTKHETLQRFKGVMQLEDLASVMKDTSLCGLGRHAPDTVLSSLAKFRKEYEAHIFDKHCEAGVCKGLKTYKIDVEKCTGCTLCAKKCPEDAIVGNIREPHFIIEDKCVGCGICYEQCKFNAILIN
ncbi:MAG: NADH-ubiquinone oxidoreductase-F iron-sulfur binding region domain-containing protein [Bacteroidota bacterium]